MTFFFKIYSAQSFYSDPTSLLNIEHVISNDHYHFNSLATFIGPEKQYHCLNIIVLRPCVMLRTQINT